MEGGLFYHSHPRGFTPHIHGPRGGYRKLYEPARVGPSGVPKQAEGDEQHDWGPHVGPPGLGPMGEADKDGDGSQDDCDQEE